VKYYFSNKPLFLGLATATQSQGSYCDLTGEHKVVMKISQLFSIHPLLPICFRINYLGTISDSVGM